MAEEFFTAFIENPDDVKVMRDVAKLISIKYCNIIAGNIQTAIEHYAEKKSPPYLLVDISKSQLPISDVSNLLEVCSPGVSLIILGTQNEVSLYRDLSKLGVYEYLLSPLFPEILERTLRGMMAGEKASEGAVKTGKIIACLGARGGTGTTFIASNLAAALAEEKLRRVVLLDIDPYFGTLSLNFDCKLHLGMREAFEDPDRIDAVFIDRILTEINDRLLILGADNPLEQKVKYTQAGLEKILSYLTKQFHYVIVDVPRYLDDITRTVISHAHIKLLIADPSVASLRDTGRLIHLFREEPNTQRCILVMNKYGQYGASELPIADFEDVIKERINHVIRYNNLLPMAAVNQGKTIVHEKNHLATSINELMFDVLGSRKSKKPLSWFERLFKS